MQNRERLYEMMHKVTGNSLNEIDWDNEFSDVSKSCMDMDKLLKYFNNVLDNHALKPNKRVKGQLLTHNKNIKLDGNGEIDVNGFINNITQIPREILSKNKKIEKSEQENEIGFNIGIPALFGLVYDIEHKKFYKISTCPGAGSCAKVCYARKGNYVLLPAVSMKQTRILNLLLNNPNLFEDILFEELRNALIHNPGKTVILRFNDAGDFFAKRFFEIGKSITKRLIEGGYKFKSYAYTKMGDVINIGDPNMILNFSDDANKREMKKNVNTDMKTSKIIPQPFFDEFLEKNERGRYAVDNSGKVIFKNNGLNLLKEKLAHKFNLPVDSIISYSELLNIPEGDKKYNVIIMPKGDGDVGARRKDVNISFLLQH